MDLNLKALVGVTYLVPIAITLRKVYAPSFEIPASFTTVLARLDADRASRRYIPRRRSAAGHDLAI